MNNTYEKLKPYRKNPVIFVVIIAVYILAIGLSVLGILNLPNDHTKDATRFYFVQPKENNNYYIDVISCTEWVCVYDNRIFYVVDDGYYSNVVSMTESQFEKLEEQYIYGLHYDETGYITPEPNRIYGQAKEIPDQVVSFIMEVFDISESDVYAYLGTYYLDTNPTSNFADSLVRPLCYLIVFLVFSFVSFATINGKNQRISLKTFNRLRDLNETDKAASELSEPTNKIFSQGDYIFSQNYIFSRKFTSITKYDDILWVYGIKLKNSTSTVLVAATKLKIKYHLIIAYGGCKEILDIIKEKNPEIRIGLNEENKAFYKNYFKYQ